MDVPIAAASASVSDQVTGSSAGEDVLESVDVSNDDLKLSTFDAGESSLEQPSALEKVLLPLFVA